MHQYLRSLKKRLKLKNVKLPTRVRYVIVIISVFAFLGVIWLQAGRAATELISTEAENGTRTGQAIIDTKANASNGKVVTFGNPQPSLLKAPTNLKAITGGNNIALLWDMPDGKIKNIEVYRNDVKVATVTPGTGQIKAEILGTRYIDKSVSRGTSYRYAVKAIDQFGVVSPLSTTVTAVHPTNTTPIPNVTIDSTATPDLTDFLNTFAKAEAETWYPKISDYLAYPDYTPISSLKLWIDPNYDGIAYVGGGLPTGTVAFGAAWARQNKVDFPNVMLHELTHAVQSYPTNPFWQIEGIADWTIDWLIRVGRYKTNVVLSTDKYDAGYSSSARVFEWAEKKYGPGIVRKLNIALHNNTYTDAMFTSLTGKTASQLFDEARNEQYRPVGTLKGADKCVEFINGDAADYAKLQLAACDGSSRQQFRRVYIDAGVSAGLLGGTRSLFYLVSPTLSGQNVRCLSTHTGVLGNGSSAIAWGCFYDRVPTYQLWREGANGTIVHYGSSKCLDVLSGNTQLILNDCSGSTSQKWTLP